MSRTLSIQFCAALVLLLLAGASGGYDVEHAPRLPNGMFLDPAGRTFDVGNMPLSAIQAPDGKLVVLLSGFREQGVQVVDPETGQVLQTAPQPAAFFGLAFSSDSKTLYASGGNEDAVYVYSYSDGVVQLKGTLALAPHEEGNPGKRYPAGLALSANQRYLYVAENMSDTLAVVDLRDGTVLDRRPAGHFPYAVLVGPDGAVYVSSWGGNALHRYQMNSTGAKIRRVHSLTVGRHPSALAMNPRTSRLFVASASTDTIAVVDTRKFRLIRTLKDPAPGAQEGSTPNAFALSSDGKTLFVAEADNNAVAVFQLSSASSGVAGGPKTDRLAGRIPAGWYPTSLVRSGNRVFVINGKGRGTRANPGASHGSAYSKTPTEYTLGQLNGTITEVAADMTENQLRDLTAHIEELNNWKTPPPAPALFPPFKHVLYIIKENRTYDQVFGDLPQGDGDPALVFFPESASPNHRALALRFGLFDRFFVNAEVSSQGHPWSTSAYVTDFREKTVHSTYSDRREEEPGEDESSDPVTGYLWDLATRGRITLRIYGEYAEPAKDKKSYHSSKKGAAAYTSSTYPAYDLAIQDQARVDAWLQEFKEFVTKGEMPALQIFHLPMDHTAGARAGFPTPAACFADNDLALGRIVEAVSQSPFWKDTILFVVEDDSQSGPDHVDSHRSVLFAISAYSRAEVWHRFVNTTDVIATMEQILGLGALSQFDLHGRPLSEIFADHPDLTPYSALVPQQSLTQKNPDDKNARNSLKLNLEKEDMSDDDVFNRILWAAIKGDRVPYPGERRISLLQIEQER